MSNRSDGGSGRDRSPSYRRRAESSHRSVRHSEVENRSRYKDREHDYGLRYRRHSSRSRHSHSDRDNSPDYERYSRRSSRDLDRRGYRDRDRHRYRHRDKTRERERRKDKSPSRERDHGRSAHNGKEKSRGRYAEKYPDRTEGKRESKKGDKDVVESNSDAAVVADIKKPESVTANAGQEGSARELRKKGLNHSKETGNEVASDDVPGIGPSKSNKEAISTESDALAGEDGDNTPKKEQSSALYTDDDTTEVVKEMLGFSSFGTTKVCCVTVFILTSNNC